MKKKETLWPKTVILPGGLCIRDIDDPTKFYFKHKSGLQLTDYFQKMMDEGNIDK